MKNRKLVAALAALVVTFVALSLPLFADKEKEKDEKGGKAAKLSNLLKEAKVSLADAIKKAEEKAGGRAVEAELEQDGDKLVWEVKVLKAGEKPEVHEVTVDAKTGDVLKVEKEDEDEKDEKDEKGAKAGGEVKRTAMAGAARPFTEHFVVDKQDLTHTGRNPYFILEPGYQLVLEKKAGGKTKRLVVTVKNETKLVDGVECRVVEELETTDDKVTERSNNFFAICKRTNNVYYFGEDAGGAWISGKDGARFGLMMPGTPLVGARFYQEIAPKVAMDRAEVLSVSETFETPAGTFKNCLRCEETTPLEPNEREHKVYAPGIGLVFDGGLKLVKHGKKE